jgi:hypothetical protein
MLETRIFAQHLLLEVVVGDLELSTLEALGAHILVMVAAMVVLVVQEHLVLALQQVVLVEVVVLVAIRVMVVLVLRVQVILQSVLEEALVVVGALLATAL